MSVTFAVPATLEIARISLDSLDGLITAKEWERAAIVYAFTRDDANGRPGKNRSEITTVFTPREFAALGISGLCSDQTVRRHRAAWQAAVDAGAAAEAAPGAEVALPELDWGEFYVSERRGQGRADSVELPATRDPGKLREHFERHPDTAAGVARAAASVLAPREKAGLAEDLSDELPEEEQAQLVDRWLEKDPQTKQRAQNARRAEREHKLESQQRRETLLGAMEFILDLTALRGVIDEAHAKWSHRGCHPTSSEMSVIAGEFSAIRRALGALEEIGRGHDGIDDELRKMAGQS